MKFISLFAGIGGFDLGFECAGMECVAQVEIDDFCQKVLSKHWPHVPKFKDVRDVGKHNLPTADLICGGFPCQDVSLAGERLGLNGKRSTLWTEFYRIVCEVRPRWVVIENVPGLFSSDDGRFFTSILWGLSEAGYDAEWDVIPASRFGAPHRRERVFIIAYPNCEPCPFSVFDWCGEEGSEWGSTEEERKENWVKFEMASGPIGVVRQWSQEFQLSPLVRVDDGIPDLLDRLRATGNAVVPQVAEYVGRCIMKAE